MDPLRIQFIYIGYCVLTHQSEHIKNVWLFWEYLDFIYNFYLIIVINDLYDLFVI